MGSENSCEDLESTRINLPYKSIRQLHKTFIQARHASNMYTQPGFPHLLNIGLSNNHFLSELKSYIAQETNPISGLVRNLHIKISGYI